MSRQSSLRRSRWRRQTAHSRLLAIALALSRFTWRSREIAAAVDFAGLRACTSSSRPSSSGPARSSHAGSLSLLCENLLPNLAGGIRVCGQRGGLHGNTGAWRMRRLVAALFHHAGIEKMLMQVVDELGGSPLKRSADTDVVEDRFMLHVFTQADAAGMRADGDAEFRRKQQHGHDLVHTAE